MDEEAFLALMAINDDDTGFPSPVPPRSNHPDPRDPNNMETLEVGVAEMEATAAEESVAPSPPANVESIDERIAFLQFHDRNLSQFHQRARMGLNATVVRVRLREKNTFLGVGLGSFPWLRHLARPSISKWDSVCVKRV